VEAAERVFAELGYHDASMVELTGAAPLGRSFHMY
jgi:AcrR family transcriptional regulator